MYGSNRPFYLHHATFGPCHIKWVCTFYFEKVKYLLILAHEIM